ncbi:MAG: hypothetical protein UW40_C0055G0004 [Parcubacteria group bacterium GW2011_GWF2_44_17]|nr:MAG: hypothetical protein UW40_C0055G0004 [Parcubacteria group bacterium GW2011_GWF2_44_17]
MDTILALIVIAFIPLALVVAFIVFAQKALHSLRDYLNANPQ